jgi:ribonuclease HII
MSLATFHTPNVLECGVDEAGRGPAIGRIYASCVFWPISLEAPQIRDSKLFKSREEREKVETYIKENALAYGVAYLESDEIDRINIHAANMKVFHMAIRETKINPEHILVDGTQFRPYMDQNDEYTKFTTIIKGDSKFLSIASASILAKCAHDRYVINLCTTFPILDRYNLRKGMGYATPEHLAAIKQHGITQYHRQSFKCCQGVPIQYI